MAFVLTDLLTYFDPQPLATELPARMPSPFATQPHLLAMRAAQIVAAQIDDGDLHTEHSFQVTGDGKMFGVLVVKDPLGRVGFLRAVSGMLGGHWLVPGFAPPVFDLAARERFWPQGQEHLAEIEGMIKEHLQGAAGAALRQAAAKLRATHAEALNDLLEQHQVAREERARIRDSLSLAAKTTEGEATLHALAEQSRGGRRQGKTLRKQQRLELTSIQSRERAWEAERLRLKRLRTQVSNELLVKIQEGYALTNGNSEQVSLASLFAPNEPPGGAGDCAAPKLLAYAHRVNLCPLALGEFWWGASPIGGGRHARHFYPPCKSKCGPILPFLLEGVEHEPAPLYATEEIADDEPRVLFDDAWLAVVHKPCGMLSVPGAHSRLKDSVLTRLQKRYPAAQGPLLVHRLDLDTSGLLVMTKSLEAYKQVQALFATRRIEKSYVAWLDGKVENDEGEISLALRVDLEDRPRQIYDPKHGKEAITVYRVLERRELNGENFTKVAFTPKTGRTHQLRVHAAHQLGLAAPIMGDRLYGKGHGRLLLHAKSLRFLHPGTREMVNFVCPLPAALAEPRLASITLLS